MARNLVSPTSGWKAAAADRGRRSASRAAVGQRLAGEHELADRLASAARPSRRAGRAGAGRDAGAPGRRRHVRAAPARRGREERGRLAGCWGRPRADRGIPAYLRGPAARALTDCAAAAARRSARCWSRDGRVTRPLADEAFLREFDGFISVSVDDRGLLSRWSELRRGPRCCWTAFVTCLPAVAIVDDGSPLAGGDAAPSEARPPPIAFLNCANPGLRNPDQDRRLPAALAEKGLPADPAAVRRRRPTARATGRRPSQYRRRRAPGLPGAPHRDRRLRRPLRAAGAAGAGAARPGGGRGRQRGRPSKCRRAGQPCRPASLARRDTFRAGRPTLTSAPTARRARFQLPQRRQRVEVVEADDRGGGSGKRQELADACTAKASCPSPSPSAAPPGPAPDRRQALLRQRGA